MGFTTSIREHHVLHPVPRRSSLDRRRRRRRDRRGPGRVGRGRAAGALGAITEYDLGAGDVRASDIVVGSDGALWFTELGANRIGRITTGGAVTTFPIDDSGQPHNIAAGPDGNLWFTYDGYPDQIGRVTTAGVVDLYELPSPDGYPIGIAAGSDGAMWFVESTGNALGRIDPGAADPEASITEYPLPTAGNFPTFITPGPDGNLWFTEQNSDEVARFTASADPLATLTEFPTGAGTEPYSITSGPDGALWSVFGGSDRVARISTAGVVTASYDVSAAGSNAQGIATGPDGNLWIADQAGNTISSLTVGGAITVYPLPNVGSAPTMPVGGPDGALWFTESNRIGRLDLTPDPTTTTTAVPTVPTTAAPTTVAPTTSTVRPPVGGTGAGGADLPAVHRLTSSGRSHPPTRPVGSLLGRLLLASTHVVLTTIDRAEEPPCPPPLPPPPVRWGSTPAPTTRPASPSPAAPGSSATTWPRRWSERGARWCSSPAGSTSDRRRSGSGPSPG